jgi:hypothetical protein
MWMSRKSAVAAPPSRHFGGLIYMCKSTDKTKRFLLWCRKISLAELKTGRMIRPRLRSIILASANHGNPK